MEEITVKTNVIWASKFWGMAAAIYILCFGIAMLMADHHIVYAQDIEQYAVAVSVVYFAATAILFWSRINAQKNDSRRNKS
jgi:hypothetical protein